ncbi:NAD(P)/FAD-dependent oxidoreductase [Propionibacteriaceae bacterium G1746]
MNHHSVVIIGAGLAGAHAAFALREQGFTGPLTLVGSEQALPYDRTKLSKEYLQGRATLAEITLQPREWYAEHSIDLRLGTTVGSIDRSAHIITIQGPDEAGAQQVHYDQLVLATGADSRRIPLPGADLPGVVTLRELGESDALHERFARGGRVAIVGTGWIGLEVAAAAQLAGMQVTAVAPVPQPLGNILGDTMGEHFANLHRHHGVDLRMNTNVSAVIERDGRAAGLVTDGGEVPADLVLLAVGAAPRVALAAEAGLDVDNGVLVDEHLRTRDPAVLAIGDIANARNTLLGKRLRREHWDNALRMGKLAAQTILGHTNTYDWLPYFYTDQFDLGMEYIGDNSPDDELVVRGSVEAGEFIAFWRREGVVTAAMNVNTWDVNDTLRGIVGRDVSAAHLKDEAVPLDHL